jgi:hypothetical protein
VLINAAVEEEAFAAFDGFVPSGETV